MQKKQYEVRKIHDDYYSFNSFFDPATGEYLRTGILDEEGRDTGREPFMASFPHLLDVGIMGNCRHGASGLCREAGDYCYQSGAEIRQPNMALDDFKNIADQCRNHVYQFALGGRGDPDQHEHFEQILSYSRECGIVPNMTTSGYGLDKRRVDLIARYCGASAVSWYRTDHTRRAINLLVSAGAKVNLHFVLGRETLEEAIDMLENEKVPAGINRIIFLLFKPVGQGRPSNILDFGPRTKHFISLIDSPYGMRMSGFDSCFVPGVLNRSKAVDPDSYDACEAGRYSAYITPDMLMVPCSFDQTLKWSVSLRKNTIREAWVSKAFAEFRTILANACPDCQRRDNCLGGCPIKPEITLCDDKKNWEVQQR